MTRLATGRLALRPVEADDLDVMHALWITPHLRRYLLDDRIVTREEVAGFLERSANHFRDQGYGLWCLHEHAGDALVGFAGFLPALDAPELIYGLGEEHAGHGFATEASRAVLTHAIASLGATRIEAGVDEPNTASVRVLGRLGFRRTGRREAQPFPLLDFSLDARDFDTTG